MTAAAPPLLEVPCPLLLRAEAESVPGWGALEPFYRGMWQWWLTLSGGGPPTQVEFFFFFLAASPGMHNLFLHQGLNLAPAALCRVLTTSKFTREVPQLTFFSFNWHSFLNKTFHHNYKKYYLPQVRGHHSDKYKLEQCHYKLWFPCLSCTGAWGLVLCRRNGNRWGIQTQTSTSSLTSTQGWIRVKMGMPFLVWLSVISGVISKHLKIILHWWDL